MFNIQKFLEDRKPASRRLDRRMTYRQTVHYRLDKGPFQRAQLEDVSGGGLRLNLPRYVPKGAKLQVLYTHPLTSRKFWVEGKVRWSREVVARYDTGVELEFQSDSDEAPFQSLMQQLATVS